MAELNISSTHPPLPPTTEDDRLDWLRLLRSRRVGPATFWRLLADHGSPRAALAALPAMAAAAGLTDYTVCPVAVVRSEIAAARAAGARSLIPGDRAWPQALNDLADCPPFLWARGDLTLLSRPMAALVGARAASSAGDRMARALAQDLSAAGFVVVSGLARGIDGAAHRGALAGGTIAVLAGGVDVLYPPEHVDLMADLAAKGLILSEQPMGLQPLARHFPQRNRIISGLSLGVVVVEAAAKSGSLITAQTALDQGREVMAVPGHPMDGRSAGCNLLIRDGAVLVRGAADVQMVLNAVRRSPRAWPVGLGPGWGVAATAREPDGLPAQSRSTRDGGGQHRSDDRQDRLPERPRGQTAGDKVSPAQYRPPQPASATAATIADPAAGPVPVASGQTAMDKPPDLQCVATNIPAAMPRTAMAALPPGAVPDSPAQPPDLRETAALHRMILDRLSLVPLAEDQLIRDLATSATDVAPVLLDMEIDGAIRRQPGGLLVRAV